MRFVAVLLCTLSAFATAQTFKSGVTAFKQADFSAALRYFLAAEAEGNQSAQLKYNLASTYYKLGRYSDAEKYFQQLIDQPKWRDLALYNTGLTAEKQGNLAQARRYFTALSTQSRNAKIKQLAERKLAATDIQPDNQFFRSILSVQAGFDDNAIAFADELQSSSSAVSDNFVELTFVGQYQRQNAGSLQAFLYTKAYQTLSSQDVSVAGVSFERPGNRSLSLLASTVDGEIAYTQLQGYLSKSLTPFDQPWEFSYEPSYFFGSSNYQQLDGWQHRLSGLSRWRWDSTQLRLKISAEVNQRDDLVLGTSRYSYSPTRYSVDTSWQWYPSTKLSYRLRGIISYSQYADENQLEDLDGVVKNQQRRGTRVTLSAEANYSVNRYLSMLCKIEHIDNQDNFDFYTYDRNQLSVGMDFSF